MAVDTVIRNCRVVTPQGSFNGGVAIDGEKIVALAQGDTVLPSAKRTIDGREHWLIPGLVDAHMHLGYPPGDLENNLHSETQSSAAGGVTTVIHLLLEEHGLVPGAERFIRTYGEHGFVDLALTAAIFSEDDVDSIPKLVDMGLPAVKFLIPYRGSESLHGLPGIDDGIIYFGFREISKLAKEGYRVFARVHTENIEIFLRNKNRLLKAGQTNVQWGEAREKICEIEALNRCIFLAKCLETPLYIVHMTVGEGPAMVARARGEGMKIWAETCPQYLTLTKNESYGPTIGKVNPPLRDRWDNDRLWEGLQNEVISVIGSDHAPTQRKDKAGNVFEALIGMPVVETMLPTIVSEGVLKGRITLERLVEVCCYNPARIYGLAPRKGMIAVGSDADLVLIDPQKKVTVQGRKLHSRSDFSPWDGRELTGWPRLTTLRGKIVVEDGAVKVDRAIGRFQAADVKP